MRLFRSLGGVLAPAVAAIGFALPAFASAPSSEPEFRAHLRDLQQAGVLGYEEALLLRFERVFDPDALPVALRSESPWPAKSVTLLVHEYESVRSGLSPALTQAIDGFLVRGADAENVLVTSHFRFAYRTDGPDAVPADDADLDGVPDFVERVGEWGETAWTRYAEAGFETPLLRDGRVDVSFREMSAYGYTQPVDGVPAIVLHRSFLGFPGNLDPEGSAAGAAKVAVAHELKHASQFVSGGWTAGGWLEADATWAEDFVFDETDDYLRYLPFGSPVSSPGQWMPASYEDCLWQQSLAQTLGPGVLVDFFARRAAQPGESVMGSFAAVLGARSSSLDDALATLGVWSYFSGANAPGRPEGFADAERFPTPPLRSHLSTAGESVTDQLDALGSHHVIVFGADRSGRPAVSFVGDRSGEFALAAVVTDTSGARSLLPVPMVSPSSSAAELPVEWHDVASIVLVATNVSATNRSQYSLTFNDDDAVGVVESAAADGLALAPARPNPFRTRTTIAFSLPEAGRVDLVVYDVAGRLIRRLHDGASLPAGPHEVTWEGLDQGGRAVAPGVYYYRLESGDRSVTRRMLRLR